MTYDYEIIKEEDYIKFSRDHGACYGNVRTTTIDCDGLKGKKLYNHIKNAAGKAFADAAKKKGFC